MEKTEKAEKVEERNAAREKENLRFGKKKLIAALAVACLMCATALADIPVIDVTVDSTLRTNFIKTIAQLVKEYEQMIYTQKYWEKIHGRWYEPTGIRDIVKARAAALGISIDELGWQGSDKYSGKPAVRAVKEAMDDLRRVSAGELNPRDIAKLRGDLELIHGSAPATVAGVKVDAAYSDMAQIAVYSGKTNQAIEELQKQIKEITDKINGGELAPGDLERLQVLLKAKEMDLETLKIRQANQSNMLQLHQTGFQASEEVRFENSRLRERYEMLSVRPMFSPARVKDEEGEE